MKTKTSPYSYYLLFFFLFIGISASYGQKDILKKSIKLDTIIDFSFGKSDKNLQLSYSGFDGPYIINDTLFRVNADNRLVILPKFSKDSIIVYTDNKDKNEFYVSLESEYKIPKTVYDLPEKMIVISDIEGNYDAFAGFLYANKVIDENHNWIYNNGHLVLVGDFVDRGKNVTQVLWLIYKLEQQAKKNNGVVHFILGNHEILNFRGDYRYNQKKYVKVAQEISQIKDEKEAVKYLYSENSELGKWLATKNIIEKIGGYIFVHAGLSIDLLEYHLGLNDMNNLARSFFRNKANSQENAANFLFSSKGPFWYRGLIMDRFYYYKITPLELDLILNYYNSKKIVVGHTFVKNVSTDFNGKVIRTDVKHGSEKFSSNTQGLLIENGEEFIIDANHVKIPLKE